MNINLKSLKQAGEKLPVSAKSAGTGSIDLFSGLWSFIHQDVAYSGANMPLHIAHQFLPDMLNKENITLDNTILLPDTYMGKGWKLNLHQSVTKITQNGFPSYVYIDSNGAAHYFNKSDINKRVDYTFGGLYTESGTNSVLNDQGLTTQIIDFNNNVLTFLNGFLTKIRTAQNDSINIEYDYKNRIKKVTDAGQRFAILTYYDEIGGEGELLYRITDSAGKKIQYEYKNGFLIKIYYLGENDSLADYSEFGYTPIGHMSTVTDQSGYKLLINTIEDRVTEIKETSLYGSISTNNAVKGSGQPNKIIKIHNPDENIVTVTVNNDSKVCYHFNNEKICIKKYEDNDTNFKLYDNPKFYISETIKNGEIITSTVSRVGSNYKNTTQTEAIPLLIATSINGNGEIYSVNKYSLNDITKIEGYINSSATTKSVANGYSFTVKDIVTMQSFKTIISCNDNKDFFGDFQSVKIFFGNNSYPTSNIEILYDGETKTTSDSSVSTTKKDICGDVTQITLQDKYGKVFSTTNTYNSEHKVLTSSDFRDIITENLFNGLTCENIMYHTNKKYTNEKVHVKNELTSSKNYVTKEWDSRYPDSENITAYNYNESADELNSVTLPNGQAVNYQYYPHSGALKKITALIDGVENYIEFTYFKTCLTQIKVNHNFIYEFIYDGYCTLTKVLLNGATIFEQSQTDNTIARAAESGILSEVYDKYGKVLKLLHNNNVLAQNQFHPQSEKLTFHTDYTLAPANPVTYSYDYNSDESLKEINFSGNGHTGKFAYGYLDDRLKTQTVTIDSNVRKSEIMYQLKDNVSIYPDNRIDRINYYKGTGNTLQNSIDYGYDSLERAKTRTVKSSSGASVGSQSYNYLNTSNSTTPFIQSVDYSNLSGQLNTAYNYDSNGNIIGVYENNVLKAKYSYDGLSRLKREDNSYFNKTTVYSYDILGNIHYKTEYPFTVNAVSGAGTVINYSYSSARPDQLIGYGNLSIAQSGNAYDNFGHPLKFFNHTNPSAAWSLEWEAGMLKRQTCSGKTLEYRYNSQGLRSQKTVNGVLHEYFYDGGNIIRENRASDALLYFYDSFGIAGFEYIINGKNNPQGSGQLYYFEKNIQGDIMAILDNSGNKVVKYVYDAWGKCLIAYDNSGISIGALNPIRYRGYYWDSETGLYYLQARYYDAEVGRFINADDATYLDPEMLNGLNLYAYCGNNPVNMIDSTGTMPTWLKWTLGIVIIVAAVALSIVTMGAATVITGAIAGALGGGLATSIVTGVVVGAVVGAASGAIASFGISVGMQGITNGFDNINWQQVGRDTAVGAISGAIMGAAMGAINGAIIGTTKLAAQGVQTSAKEIAKAAANGFSGLSKAESAYNSAQSVSNAALKTGTMAAYRTAQATLTNLSAGVRVAESSYNAVYIAYRVGLPAVKLGLNTLIKYLLGGVM